MHQHSDDVERTGLRPKGAAIDHGEERVGRAAAEGRADVIGSNGMLGLQRSVGNAGVSSLVAEERSPVLDVVSGGGTPLAPDVRADMETRLGHDFSDVRVHQDQAAQASAESVNAHAYTVGPNIVFQRDAYDPDSPAGRTTLAHELTHVVQQRSGPVDGTAAGGGIRVSDPADRFEREAAATAERVMATPPATPVAPTPLSAPVQREASEGAGVPPAVQRDAAPEEENEEEQATAQGLFVQREEQEEEPEEGGA